MHLSRTFRAAAGALALILSLSVLSSAQADDLPKAPQAHVFSLTPESGYFTEPGIAVNATNPQQVVAVF